MSNPYERLKKLGLELPPVTPPIANFVTHVQEGNFLYLSGQGPNEANGREHTGKLGDTVSVEEGYSHARITGLNLLAVAHRALGDLARVKQVVKLLGMVNATPDFEDHPKVINGCSDLLVNIFGERGRHARSAVGFGSLPGNITVEIEAIFAIEEA